MGNDFEKVKANDKLEFHGGIIFAFLPLFLFVFNAIYISVLGILSIEAMWVGAIVGLMISILFAKNKSKYAETILKGMGDPLIIVACACWIFAGVFAAILRGSGLIEGIVWGGMGLGFQGKAFVIMTFIASAIFATATGTGFGTAVVGMTLLYPAGILLGSNPLPLIGAIIGGGAFGDNIAPVSDTTIVSASSQGADIGGVVKSRLKYAAVSAVLTIIFFLLFGGGGGSVTEIPAELMAKFNNPKGLLMIIPAGLVIFLAIKKWHLISAVTAGIVVSVAVGLPSGLLSLDKLYFIKDGAIGGLIIEGVQSMMAVVILALLVMPCAKVMINGGGIDLLLDKMGKLVKTSKGAEISMAGVILPLNATIPVSVVGMLAAGPTFFKQMGEKYNISKYRRANILDGLSCTLAYTLPWTAQVLVAQSLTKDLNEQYNGLIPYVTSAEMTPWIAYCWILLGVMLFAIFTGWGKEFEIKESSN